MLAIAISLTGCTKLINVLDALGVIPLKEQKLELQLEKQVIDSLQKYSILGNCCLFPIYAHHHSTIGPKTNFFIGFE